MSEKIEGIVLNVRKYNDRNDIVTLYTKSRGRLAFISPASSSKKSNARRARILPLSIINSEFNYKPGVELQRLGSVALSDVWGQLYFHPIKRIITIFLSEFLDRLLNATMADERLWDFIRDSLAYLDLTEEKITDFHIVFLISLLSYSGVQPDVTGYSHDKVFDFASGSYVYPFESRGYYLKDEEAKAVLWISRLNFKNVRKIRLSSGDRRRILEGLMTYYTHHFPGISGIRSVEVLREIMEG